MDGSFISVISVPVSDPDVAKAFYVDVLGFEVVRDDRDVRLRWVMLRPPGAQTAITLVTWFDTMPMGSLRGTVLRVPDIEQAAAELRAKGVLEDGDEIVDAPWGRFVMIEDPDGNGWIVQQDGADERHQAVRPSPGKRPPHRRPSGLRRSLLLLSGSAAVLATCLMVAAPVGAASRPQLATTSTAATTCNVDAVLDTWPLGKLANQTIVVPAEETDVPPLAPAAKAGYGGMILFGSSAPSDLGQQLIALRRDVPDHLGFVVMTDEEGGGVQRMANLVGNMPWAATMGKTMTPAQIQTLARQVGSKMAFHGVNMNLAPVLDVDGRAVYPGPSDPDGFRSFSGNTATVTADGTAFMKGMEQGHVIPVVKHFPGLGGASGDTDYGRASTLPWATLRKVALPPFEQAVRDGVPAIMVANAWVPKLTAGVPASLSRVVATLVLRDELHFKGLLITDSLSALAISGPPLALSLEKASVEAIHAGEDMVLYNPSGSVTEDLDTAADVSKAIVSAVTAGTLPKATLVAAAAEVLATKKIDVCSS